MVFQGHALKTLPILPGAICAAYPVPLRCDQGHKPMTFAGI